MKAPKDCVNMGELRQAIDAIDTDLVALLAKRFTYIDRAAEIKLLVGLPPRTSDRVQQVIDQVRAQAIELNLDPDLIENIWSQLIENSIARETRLMDHQVSLGKNEK